MKTSLPIFFLCSFILISCNQKQEPAITSKTYFDLKAFFQTEAARLQKKKLRILKTVAKNNISESKNVAVKNWGGELDLFLESDINKPAWSSSYQVKNNRNEIQYLAKESSLRTRKIIIDKFANGDIKHIFILNQVSNNLYSSTEELHYYPDSLYSIRKKQTILILGDNDYSISGRAITSF